MAEDDKFMQLVLGLQSSAWMLLGKVANPVNGEMYRNLEEAKRTIDILMMLQEKTKGNLTDTEDKTLQSVVQQLQLNFIEEEKKDKEEKDKDPEKPAQENKGKTKKSPEQEKPKEEEKTEPDKESDAAKDKAEEAKAEAKSQETEKPEEAKSEKKEEPKTDS